VFVNTSLLGNQLIQDLYRNGSIKLNSAFSFTGECFQFPAMAVNGSGKSASGLILDFSLTVSWGVSQKCKTFNSA